MSRSWSGWQRDKPVAFFTVISKHMYTHSWTNDMLHIHICSCFHLTVLGRKYWNTFNIFIHFYLNEWVDVNISVVTISKSLLLKSPSGTLLSNLPGVKKGTQEVISKTSIYFCCWRVGAGFESALNPPEGSAQTSRRMVSLPLLQTAHCYMQMRQGLHKCC